MVTTIEGKIYQIPIPDKPLTTPTGKLFVQTCEIPVIHTEENIDPFTFQYLRFSIIPGEYSPLDILAGGGNLEIAGARIRAQMIHRLETVLAAMQKPDPLPHVLSEIKQLGTYFQLIQPPQ